MRVNITSLRNILLRDVCEIQFLRRRQVAGKRTYRNMLCTLNMSLLNSVNGRITLNYSPPVSLPNYNPIVRNLLCVWDILMQDWRMVNMDDCSIIKRMTGDETFWKIFTDDYINMSSEQKQAFMGI